MILIDISALIAGLVLLTYAADWLVAGAVALAHRMGVSALFIGLTVVSFGTSMPEVVVSVQASLEGKPGIAVGNVVGSNIFNAALILGVAALIKPIACSRAVVRREVPIMILVSGLLWWMAKDLILGRFEALFLLLILIIYIKVSYELGKREAEPEIPEEVQNVKPSTLLYELVLIIAGLVGLIGGSKLLLYGAVNIAKAFGISDEVIGLTLIAAGTSLPELATSAVASWRGNPEIAVGNVVGSNIFNILGILGIAGTILPLSVSDQMLGIDIPVMFVVSLGCLPIMHTGMRIIRAEGLLLLTSYLVYMYSLFQR